MGSAASVACGMVPAALGTQTNGSVIRPAAFCGCVGYKPSAGLIPRDGMLEFSATLDQVGVFARSVADAALVASVLADRPLPVAPLARPPQLAAVRSPMWHLADEVQRARFARDIELLRRAGAAVEETEPGESFASAHAMHRCIMYAEGARALGELQAQHRGELSVALNRLIDEGRQISAAEYREALTYREALRNEFERFLEAYDAILTPPARGEAPATLENTGDPAFCTLWTLAGAPAITLPTGFGPNRLPLGLQLVGRTLADAGLLGVAQWCAAAIGFDIGFPDDRS
jgi:Asp-tRNA(Asn)/Glu-tRNA(Gln) amidotransferase A subunit family amidase